MEVGLNCSVGCLNLWGVLIDCDWILAALLWRNNNSVNIDVSVKMEDFSDIIN